MNEEAKIIMTELYDKYGIVRKDLERRRRLGAELRIEMHEETYKILYQETGYKPSKPKYCFGSLITFNNTLKIGDVKILEVIA